MCSCECMFSCVYVRWASEPKHTHINTLMSVRRKQTTRSGPTQLVMMEACVCVYECACVCAFMCMCRSATDAAHPQRRSPACTHGNPYHMSWCRVPCSPTTTKTTNTKRTHTEQPKQKSLSPECGRGSIVSLKCGAE